MFFKIGFSYKVYFYQVRTLKNPTHPVIHENTQTAGRKGIFENKGESYPRKDLWLSSTDGSQNSHMINGTYV